MSEPDRPALAADLEPDEPEPLSLRLLRLWPVGGPYAERFPDDSQDPLLDDDGSGVVE